MKATEPSVLRYLAVAVLVASVSLLTIGPTDARQRGCTPLSVLPGGQGSGGSVLEIPNGPRQPQALPEPAVPMAPQVGPELEIPSRQLRTQPGYAQVTVTITDRRGSISPT